MNDDMTPEQDPTPEEDAAFIAKLLTPADELEMEQKRHLSILALLNKAPDPSTLLPRLSVVDDFLDDDEVGKRTAIKWEELSPHEKADTLAELGDWLEWFLPTWRFGPLEFAFGCWWQHQYLVEEYTAIWLAWLTNYDPIGAAPTDPLHFNERVAGLRRRLDDVYRGQCKDGHHADIPLPKVARPSSAPPADPASGKIPS